MSDSNTDSEDPKNGPTDVPNRLKESQIKVALADLDWQALIAHIDAVGFDRDGLGFLLGHIRRTSSLIMPYPDSKREARRAKFFSSVTDYVRSTLGGDAGDAVTAEAATIHQVEQGYRGILKMLNKCEISRLPPEVRASACITRAGHQFWLLQKEVNATLRSRKEITLPLGPLLAKDGSLPISPDAILTTIVDTATITLLMEGHKNKWFDADGFLVLPMPPKTGEDEQFKAGSTELLAICWLAWRRAEERWRYLGGSLQSATTPDLPSWVPKGVEQVTTYQPDDSQVFDFIANERLNDRLGMTLLQMMNETDIGAKAVGILRPVPLLPEAFVTIHEAHAAVSLSETLSYDVAADRESPGGLRFVEWLRGYAVLARIAEDRSHSATDADNIVLQIAAADLIATLDRCGLKDGAAERFINAVTLAKSSGDLFDCPLIKLADGSFLMFGPGLISSNPARIILSQISNRDEPLARKGKAFEAEMLRFIKRQGLVAASFKKHCDGEEYEYDLVFVWGDYVFVIECKNHSLSSHHPVQAYYFGLELASSAKQTQRLVENLIRRPEILREQFGIEVTEKKIIPCVVNSLPYALPGRLNDVYFTDASGLRRFFQDRYFHMNSPHQIGSEVRVLHRTATHSLWEGDSPSPDDFIRQLEDPFQLKLMLAHIRMGTRLFAITPTHAVCVHHFVRAEMSIDSYADVVGISAGAVRKDVATVSRQVQKLRKRIAKRKKPRSR